MTRPFGYNVFQSDGLWDHARRLNPRAMLFINDLAGALNFARDFPDCKVAHRVVVTEGDYQENVLHRHPGRTLEFLQQRIAEVDALPYPIPLRLKLWTNLGCEPSIENLADLQKLADETMKAAEWAVAHQRKVILLHLAHYGFDNRHWAVLAPLLDYAAKHKDYLIVGADEYGGGHMFSGVVDPRFPGTNETAHINPDHWQPSPLNKYFHVGRITDAIAYQKAMGLGVPTIWITEHGLDALGDIQGWRTSLKKAAGYDDIRGWKSEVPQLEAWYGANGVYPRDWSAARAFGKMITAARAIYAPTWNPETREGVEVELIFGWRDAGDKTWDQFSVAEARDFQEELEHYEEASVALPPTPKPLDCGTPILSEVQTSGFIRVRHRPSIEEGTEVYQALQGDRVYYFPGGHVEADGFEWAYVELQTLDADGHSRAGWMARVPPSRTWEQQFKSLVVVTPPIEEPPPVEPDPIPLPPVVVMPPLPEWVKTDSEAQKKIADILRLFADIIEHYPGVPITSASAEIPQEFQLLEGVH